MSPFSVLALLLAVGPEGASNLAGSWVPAELKGALESGAPREMPCFLVVETEPSLQVAEDCAGERTGWSGTVAEAPRAGTLEVKGIGASGETRLVIRAGAPNELERISVTPEGERQVQRLYRVPPLLEERLRGWSEAERVLVGSWRTDDGTEVSFAADGSYRLGREKGRFELEPGSPVEGAWAELRLQPGEGEHERRYLVTGEGKRLGLAIPPELPPAAPAGAGGAEAGGGAGIGSGFGGSGGAEVPEPVRPVLDPASVTLWLNEVQPPPAAAAQPVPPPVPEGQAEAPAAKEEPPPIAQPIEPRRRGCGCSAGEGVGLLALAPALGLAKRRRRQDDAPIA